MDDYHTWYTGLTTKEKGEWLKLKFKDETWYGFWSGIYLNLLNREIVCDRDDRAYRTES